jgi:D-alanyl-lipoteichoic acid acyltransferase DltB (MBOAT superfamily)
MSFEQILAFSGLALLATLVLRGRGRAWLLMVTSVIAVYWLQPATPIRNLDFWLPTATIGLTIVVWALTREEKRFTREDGIAAGVIAGSILIIGLTRYLSPQGVITATRPPQTWQVLAGMAAIGLLAFLGLRLFSGRTLWLNLAVAVTILAFVILKTEALAQGASQALRGLNGQNPNLATAFDIRWLGFSYIAFRLLHILRDRINGRLPEIPLRDFLTYTIFFPALTAGPIDKIQRFSKDLDQNFTLDTEQLVEGSKRIVVGVFMKFALADTLALFALNETNSLQTGASVWMWALTYAYAFRIYFDFAGYTHIAIGIGMLFGIQLPENFSQPYRKPNLTQFWNSWHMTLAQWFRSYFFNPFTRTLRGRKVSIPVIILFGQLGTMVLIGLWHGVTWNFVIWGLWHGLGLFIHNRWAEYTKARPLIKNQRLSNILGILVTFHYVLLGWVWFALPNLDQALHTFRILFGGGG